MSDDVEFSLQEGIDGECSPGEDGRGQSEGSTGAELEDLCPIGNALRSLMSILIIAEYMLLTWASQ